MTVVTSGIIPVHEPLLQLSMLPDLMRRQPFHSLSHRATHLFVHAQYLGSLRRIVQHVTDDLHVHCRCEANVVRAMRILRRSARGRDEVAMSADRLFHHAVHEKERGTLYRRIDIRQKVFVGRVEKVMFPQMGTQPPCTGGPQAPCAIDRCGTVPEVRVVVFHPTLRNAPMHLRGLLALGHHALHLVDQRNGALGKVGGFSHPVIHLQVDVGRVLTSPDRVRILVPNALQIGRLSARAGRGDEQITSELVIEFNEIRVVRRVEVPHAPRRDVRRGGVRFAHVQAYTIEQGLIISQMVG